MGAGDLELVVYMKGADTVLALPLNTVELVAEILSKTNLVRTLGSRETAFHCGTNRSNRSSYFSFKTVPV